MNKREFGWIGEASAEGYLNSLGFETVGKNVYVGRCEIDLIVKSDTHILFVEVKTSPPLRQTRNLGECRKEEQSSDSCEKIHTRKP